MLDTVITAILIFLLLPVACVIGNFVCSLVLAVYGVILAAILKCFGKA